MNQCHRRQNGGRHSLYLKDVIVQPDLDLWKQAFSPRIVGFAHEYSAMDSNVSAESLELTKLSALQVVSYLKMAVE